MKKGFLLGAVVGAAGALLLTPRTGKEWREWLKTHTGIDLNCEFYQNNTELTPEQEVDIDAIANQLYDMQAQAPAVIEEQETDIVVPVKEDSTVTKVDKVEHPDENK